MFLKQFIVSTQHVLYCTWYIIKRKIEINAFSSLKRIVVRVQQYFFTK